MMGQPAQPFDENFGKKGSRLFLIKRATDKPWPMDFLIKGLPNDGNRAIWEAPDTEGSLMMEIGPYRGRPTYLKRTAFSELM